MSGGRDEKWGGREALNGWDDGGRWGVTGYWLAAFCQANRNSASPPNAMISLSWRKGRALPERERLVDDGSERKGTEVQPTNERNGFLNKTPTHIPFVGSPEAEPQIPRASSAALPPGPAFVVSGASWTFPGRAVCCCYR